MSPRNTAAAPTPTTADAPTPTTADADPLAGLDNTNPDAAVADLLKDAKSLDDEKRDVYGRIDANRQILRNYQKLGKGSDAQRAAIDLFYPKPNRKAKADETATA